MRGFTLIELLISVLIIGIITTLVIVRYKEFDSTVLLKSAAYEVAFTLRETQVQSVSAARGAGNNFDYPRGLSFTPGANTYVSFQFQSPTSSPFYDQPTAVDLKTITLDRSMVISDVCVTVGVAETCSPGITRLDISFKRPEFRALFYAVDGGGGQFPGIIEKAKIKVHSPTNPANVFWVIVSQLGQITVAKQP